MSVEKTKLKMEIIHSLGCDFDDGLESAKREVPHWQGGNSSLKEGAKAVEALLGAVAREVKDQKVSLEAGEYAQKQIRRAAELLRNLALRAQVMEHKAQGRIEALELVVKTTKKLFEQEAGKLEALENDDGQREDDRGMSTRPTGAHPGDPLAERREEVEIKVGVGQEQ